MLPARSAGRVLLCCSLFLLSRSCRAEGPYTVPPGWEHDGDLLVSGGNPARRNDFCARQEEVSTGKIQLRDALQGLNISIMVNLMEWGPWDGTFGACGDVKMEGCVFHGAVIDEMSRRAGFHFKDSFAIGDSRLAANYKEWMLWVARNYDVGIGIATETADRLSDGLVWNAYLTDNSFVLASRKVLEEGDVVATLFQFLRPFSWQVWCLLIGSGTLSSLLYVITERHVNHSDLPAGTFIEQLGDAFMLACFQFTQAGGFTPRTAAGRGITFTWGLTTLLTVSAYTANLATFLISRGEAGFGISTIDEANAAGAKICHRQGWAIERHLATNYPRVMRVPTSSQAEAWEKLREGECDAEAMFISGFRTEEAKKSYNPVCEMALTPALPFSAQSGGWYSESDNGFLCTGLVKDVFQLYMSEMVVDGRIEKFFSDFIEFGAAADPRGFACPKDGDADEVGERPQMGLENMGGIYIIHAAMTALAALTILEICLWRKTHKRHHSSQPEPDAPPPATVDLLVCAPGSAKGKVASKASCENGAECCGCGQLRARVDEMASRGEELRVRLDAMARDQQDRHAQVHAMLEILLAAVKHESKNNNSRDDDHPEDESPHLSSAATPARSSLPGAFPFAATTSVPLALASPRPLEQASSTTGRRASHDQVRAGAGGRRGSAGPEEVQRTVAGPPSPLYTRAPPPSHHSAAYY